MTKATKTQMYTAIMNFIDGGKAFYETDTLFVDVDKDAMLQFCQKELDILAKKAAKAKETAQKKKTEADELQNRVATVLTDEFQTIAAITSQIEGEDVTVSKVTYRLSKLVAANIAEKSEISIPSASESGKTRKVMGYRNKIDTEQE